MSSPAVQVRSRAPRLADLAVARARLTVVPRRRPTAPTMPFVMLVTLMLVGGVVSLLLFNTSMQQAAFAASDLEDQADTMTAREQTLRMELEELRNPQRVAEQAHQMGMVLPAASGFVHLSDGSIVPAGVPTEPVPPLRLQPLPPRKPAVLTPTPIVVPAAAGTAGQGDTGSTSPAADRGHGRNGAKHRQAHD